jgi:uncharacterized protein YegP (UPF0339 family)
MAAESSGGSFLARWYRNRIGTPTTGDEVTGYWIFTLGVILGIIGIGLLIQSTPATTLRQWAIILAATGLVLLLVGPIIRLPLERNATYISYLGVIISAAAIVWFFVAFPAQWDPRLGNPQIVGLYSIGLVVIAIGGLFVPLLRPVSPDESEDDAAIAEKDDVIADLESENRRLQSELDDVRQSKARFQLYEDNSGEWRWHLRHRNGNIIADSAEGYTARHNAVKGLESVRRNALGAETLQLPQEEAEPEEEVSFEPFEEIASRADFEVYQDEAGEWRWRLEHDNGNIIADSGEGYASRSNANRAVDSTRRNAPVANYLDIDPTAFEVYEDEAGEWRWRLLHRNGNILADSGEGYASKQGAQNAITTIKALDDVSFVVYEDQAGEWRWRLEHSNGNIMADSGEGYSTESGAEDAVDRVEGYVPDAKVADSGPSSFEVYEDEAGEWRWRLRHRNGNVLADSGEGYTSRRDAIRGIESVKRNVPGAETV